MDQILIVDDDRDICESLSLVLKSAGYDTVTFASGQEAYDYIMAENPVSLMLLDSFMPNMKGEELLEKLQQRDMAPPTLIVSGAMSPWLSHKMVGYGVGYLAKPINPDFMLNIIKTLLKKQPANTN